MSRSMKIIKISVHAGYHKIDGMYWKIYMHHVTLTVHWDSRIKIHFSDASVIVFLLFCTCFIYCYKKTPIPHILS